MYTFSDRSLDYQTRLTNFMEQRIYPNEEVWAAQRQDALDPWAPLPLIEELKAQAREAGLWNLALPHSRFGPRLTNFDYAPLAEIMGRVHWCSEVFNCHAPESGNMEMLERYGTEQQIAQWLPGLTDGRYGSAFAMTEPDVASSDATNIQTRIERDGDHYVINGRKWWTSGAAAEHCRILFVVGQTNPEHPSKHLRQSIIIGYTNAWVLYVLAAGASIPLCLLARLPKAQAPAPG